MCLKPHAQEQPPPKGSKTRGVPKFLGGPKRDLGRPRRSCKIGPGAQKSTLGGRPPTFLTCFFRTCFRIVFGIDFGSILGGSDTLKSSWHAGKTQDFKITFFVPEPVFHPKWLHFGRPKPLQIFWGRQNAFLEASGEITKIDLGPKNLLFGGTPCFFKPLGL